MIKLKTFRQKNYPGLRAQCNNEGPYKWRKEMRKSNKEKNLKMEKGTKQYRWPLKLETARK